ncbi:hypothetical protein RND81_01G182200 [Saponaria officinalis]|uniref:Cytochrome b5 heme-binding domain-containing protein n=1 Tax=Saponaria officinalis TaxID=3572 RepID=A0AAW1NH10_SAPOF
MENSKKYISEEELKTHNKRDDIWISILGKVYNVSKWVDQHPGGELPLLYFAGQDVTDVFLAYHPISSTQYLNRFFNGYFLKDYKVSDTSKDYRKLLLEFQKMGLFNKKGHIVSISMFVIVMLFLVGVYGVLKSDCFWVHMVCGVLLGLSWIQIGWIGHDSSHYQALVTPMWNRVMHFVMVNCIAGVSISWWKRSHNAHHIACNSLEFDPDMQHMPFMAVSTKFFNSLTSHFYDKKLKFDSISRFFISRQHITFYPIFAFLRIFFYVQSFYLLLFKRKVPNRSKELVGLLVFWIWYSFLISCLPTWIERISFAVITLAVTGIQQFQFSLNHLSCEVYVDPPKGNDWLEKQVIGSLDISCSPWMDWFHGGLQFQIEHHLFPRMPRCNLRKIAPFVKDLCKKHDIPYKCASFWEANVMTYTTVRAAALAASDRSNLVPRNLVWETMTTH